MSARRRPKGEGTVSPYRAGQERRWKAEWREDGRRRSRAGFATRQEALTFLAQVRVTAAAGGSIPDRTGGETLQDAMTAWLETLRLAPATVAAYRRYARRHVWPTLGRRSVRGIKPRDLALLYRSLEDGTAPGQKRALGPNSVLKTHNLLSSFFQEQIDAEVVATNPARHPGAKPPTPREVRQAKPAQEIWDATTLRAFYRFVESRPRTAEMAVAWRLIAATGIRRGEAVGLRWEDLDLATGVLHVRRAMSAIREKGKPTWVAEGLPKGGRPRSIDLDSETLAAVRAYRQERASIAPSFVAPGQPVFGPLAGGAFTPDALGQRFPRAVAGFRQTPEGKGAPALTMHGLRHSHASLLLAAGVPAVDVADRLGHSSTAVTLGVYAHVLAGAQKRVSQAWGSMLSGDAEAPTPGAGEVERAAG